MFIDIAYNKAFDTKASALCVLYRLEFCVISVLANNIFHQIKTLMCVMPLIC